MARDSCSIDGCNKNARFFGETWENHGETMASRGICPALDQPLPVTAIHCVERAHVPSGQNNGWLKKHLGFILIDR